MKRETCLLSVGETCNITSTEVQWKICNLLNQVSVQICWIVLQGLYEWGVTPSLYGISLKLVNCVLCIWQPAYCITNQVFPNSNASDLYFGDAQFKSRQWHQLSLRHSFNSSFPLDKLQDGECTCCLPHPFQFVARCPAVHSFDATEFSCWWLQSINCTWVNNCN
jgi:hypothetical protein